MLKMHDQPVAERYPRDRGKIEGLIAAILLRAEGEEKIIEAQNL